MFANECPNLPGVRSYLTLPYLVIHIVLYNLVVLLLFNVPLSVCGGSVLGLVFCIAECPF